MKAWEAVVAISIVLAAPSGVLSQRSATAAEWMALASDRIASRPGDTLVVLISEIATASSASQRAQARQTRLGGGLRSASGANENVELELARAFDGGGRNSEDSRMLAEVSVLVTSVLPNGDLEVAGAETLKVNGEVTRIAVRGRVRPQDISSANVVLSSRLANAEIAFEGAGFDARAARPGWVTRVLDWADLF